MDWNISAGQVLMLIITTVIASIIGGIINYQFSKYKKYRQAQDQKKEQARLKAEEDRKKQDEKLERISIDIQAMDYGLEKSPGINGNYTRNKNEKRAELIEKSQIINE